MDPRDRHDFQWSSIDSSVARITALDRGPRLAEADLQQFLHKVNQLNALVACLETDPERRARFAACTDHNQVVQLASSWGFAIGRRWGDAPQSVGDRTDNLLGSSAPPAGEEVVQTLQRGPDWRLQTIHSSDAASPQGFWYDQEEHEWLVVLRGSATIRLEGPEELRDLSVGDSLYLEPHRRHRVERTDPDPGTLWLVLLWKDRPEAVVGCSPA